MYMVHYCGVCVCACVCAHACMRACVCVSECMCVCACLCVYITQTLLCFRVMFHLVVVTPRRLHLRGGGVGERGQLQLTCMLCGTPQSGGHYSASPSSTAALRYSAVTAYNVSLHVIYVSSNNNMRGRYTTRNQLGVFLSHWRV